MSITKTQLSEALQNAKLFDQEFIDEIISDTSHGLINCNYIALAATVDEAGVDEIHFCLLHNLDRAVNAHDIFISIKYIEEGENYHYSRNAHNVMGDLLQYKNDLEKCMKAMNNLSIIKAAAIEHLPTFNKINKARSKKVANKKKAGVAYV